MKLGHSSAWSDQKTRLIRLLEEKTEGSIERALQILGKSALLTVDHAEIVAKITDTLELYAPVLKGLQDVHGFTTDYLEKLVFDQNIAEKWAGTAAYLYGGYNCLFNLVPTILFMCPYQCPLILWGTTPTRRPPEDSFTPKERQLTKGQSMGMSSITAEGIPLALETVLMRQDVHGANISLCILLGVERSNTTLFEGHLTTLLRQVQVAAFSATVSGGP